MVYQTSDKGRLPIRSVRLLRKSSRFTAESREEAEAICDMIHRGALRELIADNFEPIEAAVHLKENGSNEFSVAIIFNAIDKEVTHV